MKRIVWVLIICVVCGCMLKTPEHKIKTSCEVTPSRVSLSDKEKLKIEVRVTNIGKNKEIVTVEVGGTEGLEISVPSRTTFMLKPEESRIISFPAELTPDALPGDYVIDVKVSTESGENVTDVAKVRVVEKKGWL
ncbi:MAG: hypothetical protein DRN25_07725 [Thermoplasmata archaeon]|nr:MAG: hypothetical protein DRN25_07725 [Thermoplasmata archaeon]